MAASLALLPVTQKCVSGMNLLDCGGKMSSYFVRQKGSAFLVIALLLLFAAACVTDPGAVLVSMRQAGTTDDGLD